MFSKKRRKEPAIRTLIGGDTRVNGDLEFTGGCLIDGAVMGNVRSVGDEDATLSISERGRVEGTIDVPNVLLNGTVQGDVKAVQRVELGGNARVHGDVQYGLIEMAIGAEVNGKMIHASETGRIESEETRADSPEQDEPVPAGSKVKVVGEST